MFVDGFRSASQKITPLSLKNDLQLPVEQYESNSLRPKKEGVKFNSMLNLKYSENDNVQLDQNLNPNSNASSLTNITLENKKKKSKVKNLFNKIFPLKATKYNSNVIEEVPKHKNRFFARSDKRKVALVN